MSDDTLASRVASRVASQLFEMKIAARFAYTVREADEGGEDQPPNAKGGVPPRWKEWLDATKGGGKKKVPNPNPDTRESHPQVSFTTALKDPPTFTKAMKEYHEWAKKNPEPKRVGPHEPRKQEEETKEKPTPTEKPKTETSGPDDEGEETKAPKLELKGAMALTDATVDAMLNKHKAKFEALTKTMKSQVEGYEKALNPKERERFAKLPEGEKILHVGGHEIGQYFEKEVLNEEQKELQDYYLKSWKTTSGGNDSQHLHGLLERAGVNGSRTDNEEGNSKVDKARSFGATDKELQAYAGQIYAFQQAYFKHLGLKELTLYRGVRGQGLDETPPKEGDLTNLATRELSSFTSDYEVADGYGRAIEFKVPVERVFGSSLIRPAIGSTTSPGSFGEAELMIMGATDLKGTVANKGGHGLKTAASSSVHMDETNEDWLTEGSLQKFRDDVHHRKMASEVILSYTEVTPMSEVRDFQDAVIVAKLVQAAKGKTYQEAQQEILTALKSKGWKIVTGLKIPHATSPDGKLRLWFKAQAIWSTFDGEPRGSRNMHEFKNARSTWIDDIRKMDADKALAEIERIKKVDQVNYDKVVRGED